MLAEITETKRKSSELHEDKKELQTTLDFITNENGELNEKLLALTTKLETIERNQPTENMREEFSKIGEKI